MTTAEKLLSDLSLDVNTFDAFKQLIDYWQSIRGDKPCPFKSDFSPAGVKSLLSEIAIMELLPDNSDVVFRLVAAGLMPRSPRDLTGASIGEMLSPDQAARALDAYRYARKRQCGAYAYLDMYLTKGHQFYEHVLLLPLADDQGEARFFITCYFLPEKRALAFAPEVDQIDYTMSQINFLDIGNGV